MLSFALSGIFFGLVGGFSPGPLSAFIIGQSLRFGLGEGIKVSFAPVITDGPLVALIVFSFASMTIGPEFLGTISFLGALFLLYLSYDAINAARITVDRRAEAAPGSLRKAVATNLLNPHPYVFWSTVGGPIAIGALEEGTFALGAFCLGFGFAIVSANIFIAWSAHRAQNFFEGSGYRTFMRLVGFAMLIFAGLFVWRGIELFA